MAKLGFAYCIAALHLIWLGTVYCLTNLEVYNLLKEHATDLVIDPIVNATSCERQADSDPRNGDTFCDDVINVPGGPNDDFDEDYFLQKVGYVPYETDDECDIIGKPDVESVDETQEHVDKYCHYRHYLIHGQQGAGSGLQNLLGSHFHFHFHHNHGHHNHGHHHHHHHCNHGEYVKCSCQRRKCSCCLRHRFRFSHCSYRTTFTLNACVVIEYKGKEPCHKTTKSSRPTTTHAPTTTTNAPTTTTHAPTTTTHAPTTTIHAPTTTTHAPTTTTHAPTTTTHAPTTTTQAKTTTTQAGTTTTPCPCHTTTTPAITTTTPAITTTTPAIITTTPAIITTSPAIITTSPAIITTKPAIITTTPAIITTSPAIITTKPAIMTTTPAIITTTALTPPPNAECPYCERDIYDVTFTVNKRKVFENQVTLDHLHPLCYNLRLGRGTANVCINFYSVNIRRKRVCTRLTGVWTIGNRKTKIHMNVGCMVLSFSRNTDLMDVLANEKFWREMVIDQKFVEE